MFAGFEMLEFARKDFSPLGSRQTSVKSTSEGTSLNSKAALTERYHRNVGQQPSAAILVVLLEMPRTIVIPLQHHSYLSLRRVFETTINMHCSRRKTLRLLETLQNSMEAFNVTAVTTNVYASRPPPLN